MLYAIQTTQKQTRLAGARDEGDTYAHTLTHTHTCIREHYTHRSHLL